MWQPVRETALRAARGHRAQAKSPPATYLLSFPYARVEQTVLGASGNQIIIIIVVIIIHIIIVDLCSVEETSSPAIIYIFSVANTHLIIVITTLSFYYLHSVTLSVQTCEHHFSYLSIVARPNASK